MNTRHYVNDKDRTQSGGSARKPASSVTSISRSRDFLVVLLASVLTFAVISAVSSDANGGASREGAAVVEGTETLAWGWGGWAGRLFQNSVKRQHTTPRCVVICGDGQIA